MQILYVGYYTADDILYEIQNRGINNMSVARQNFEVNLLRGLIEESVGDTLHFVTYVPTDDQLQIPAYSELDGQRIYHIPINRKKVSSILRAEKLFAAYLESLGRDVLQGLRVLMYEVNPMFLRPLLRLRKKYGIKLITLCAELSVLRRSKKIKYQIRNQIFSYYERKFDGYILFAKPMQEALRCEDKPQIVLEGIAPAVFGEPTPRNRNIVMYAGGLGTDNNMELLIESCRKLDELEELWICGTGKDQRFVAEAAQREAKIKYFGMTKNDRVRELETKAKVLINLRTPDAIITRYSFPSKILEYLASGTLVMSTRLEGIPEEYYSYIVPIETLSPDSVAAQLRQVFRKSEDEYVAQTRKAQEFISKNKNRNIQSKKVLAFVHGLE